MEEIGKEKESDVKTTTSNSKGKSCKGCLYYSSVLKSNSRHPLCIGLTRSVQVQGYFVGKSELAATKEGRSLTDFKYGCLGYSVYLDEQKASADTPEQKVILPVCVGVELLVSPASSSADHVPAPFYDKEDGHHGSSKPRSQKPASTTGDEFLNRFTRNAGLVAAGVTKNLVKVGNHLKARFEDILYRRPK
uniref:DUF8204 domain-containing protein n=1 Tax=Kalanchoe fedtschenkoi TaxID=63787 RepID=A0A7N0TPL5_KALFE